MKKGILSVLALVGFSLSACGTDKCAIYTEQKDCWAKVDCTKARDEATKTACTAAQKANAENYTKTFDACKNPPASAGTPASGAATSCTPTIVAGDITSVTTAAGITDICKMGCK